MSNGRAVICDDDALVRSVIRQVLAESPIEIVGEAESPEDAMVTIRDSTANILVLDLALRGGSGERLLQWVREQHRNIHVVVYSAYAADASQLLAAGATAVIEKPDFGRLLAAVDGIAAALGVPADRRRREARDVGELPAPTSLSVSGFEPWESFLAVTGAAGVGDAILCADILPESSTTSEWDPVLELDHRVALGRAMATGRRTQDRVSIGPNGRPVLLLIAGHPEAPTAVFQRLSDRWAIDVGVGSLVGAFGLIHAGDDPLERLILIESSFTMDRAAPLRMV